MKANYIVRFHGKQINARIYDRNGGNDMMKVFDCKGTDSELTKYDGCLCEVERELTKDEADIDEVGKMYHIKFMDGYETDAFEDELH